MNHTDCCSSRVDVSIYSVTLFGLFVALFAQSLQASVLNRKAVVESVKGIDANYESDRVRIFLEGQKNEDDPGVFVGDAVKFQLSSDEARYYLMLLVDPKGQASVIFPDLALGVNPKTYHSFEYPPAGTGDVLQDEPVGIQTVVFVASDKALSASSLGLSTDTDIHDVGDNAEAVGGFAANINDVLSGTNADAAVYTYFVDADVQYGTRAVRREIRRRKEQIEILAEQQERDNSTQVSTSQVSEGQVSNSQSERVARVQSDVLSVNDIRFEVNSDVLTQTGRMQLEIFGGQLEQVILDDPTIIVTLEGHTDSTGSTTYNQNLSERRAESARRHLLQNFDMPAQNVIARGLGESRPIESNASAQTRAKNRRVEISLGK